MAFKFKLKKYPDERLRDQTWFHLAYFLVSEAIIFYGVYLDRPGISSIGGMMIVVPLFLFFFSVFEHIVSPRYEEPLIPDVQPPRFNERPRQEPEAKPVLVVPEAVPEAVFEAESEARPETKPETKHGAKAESQDHKQ